MKKLMTMLSSPFYDSEQGLFPCMRIRGFTPRQVAKTTTETTIFIFNFKLLNN
jgi:hypothetical protein